MKATGVVRQLDRLGRIVLPVELRRTMDITTGDSLEIFVDGNMIVLKKYQPCCVFCMDAGNVKPYRGKLICERCLQELRTGAQQ